MSYKLMFEIEKPRIEIIISEYKNKRTIPSFDFFIRVKDIVKEGVLLKTKKPSKKDVINFLNANAKYLISYADLFWQNWDKLPIESFGKIHLN